MDFMEVSLLHHAGIVLLFLWLLSTFNCCHPIAYFLCLVYLYLVHERFILRLRKKLQHEERRQGNQRRILTDSETVRWLNHAVEKIWPICMENIASQKILLPIIPWFLDKYKPWTAKKALVQHLYLGRNPPLFTEMRVLSESSEDDHLVYTNESELLVLELGMNFLTADDMSAILAVQLRKRLGFGMWARLHLTGMHIEGKVLVGVKFLQTWPFISRLRLCFAEPPYFQMNVKPLFTHGLDVTELPGIAGWLDKLLSVAFEQTLVEPNMLVVDMEKFVSPKPAESWFSVDVKEPVAYAKLEVIEASDMKPSDLNGLADPYVKGQLGLYRFKTKIQKKTLFPKWHEEFKIPIVSWESENVLVIEVRDKDHFIDDLLGVCSINISDKRDGQRHDMWLPLQNVNTGRLHLVVTIFEENEKVDDQCNHEEEVDGEDSRKNSFKSETADKDASLSLVSSRKSQIVADNFEPIDVEGKTETGIWVHHPGSEVPKTWEPRKGKSRRLDTKVQGKANPSITITNVDDDGSGDENAEEKQQRRLFLRGFQRLSAIFHRSPRKDEQCVSLVQPIRSPSTNVRAVNAKRGGVKLVLEEKVVVEEKLIVSSLGKVAKEGKPSSEDSDQESALKGNAKGKSMNIFRYVFSREGSDKSPGNKEKNVLSDSDSSEDDENTLLPLPQSPTVREISNDLRPLGRRKGSSQIRAKRPTKENNIIAKMLNSDEYPKLDEHKKRVKKSIMCFEFVLFSYL